MAESIALGISKIFKSHWTLVIKAGFAYVEYSARTHEIEVSFVFVRAVTIKHFLREPIRMRKYFFRAEYST